MGAGGAEGKGAAASAPPAAAAELGGLGRRANRRQWGGTALDDPLDGSQFDGGRAGPDAAAGDEGVASASIPASLSADPFVMRRRHRFRYLSSDQRPRCAS